MKAWTKIKDVIKEATVEDVIWLICIQLPMGALLWLLVVWAYVKVLG